MLPLLLLAVAQGAHLSACFSATPGAAATQIQNDARAFVRQTEMLDSAAGDFRARKISRATLQEQLRKTRIAYKRVEFVLEYYYPEHIKAYINGPPILHPDPYPYQELLLPDEYYGDSSAINIAPLDYQEPNAYLKPREVVKPNGLQALDEIIFTDSASLEIDPLLTADLVKRSKIVAQALLRRRYIEDYQIIEAVRLEMVRIFTLGLTGFDTPGSLNAIDEAKTALSAVARAIELTIDNASLDRKTEIAKLFATSMTLLEGRHFDDLDRLQFLMVAANPLYRALQQAHQELKLKNSADLTYETQPWNAQSQNLFANDFLNPYAFTLLKKEQDSDALRALGRKIFFDNQLSEGGSLSCSSCHRPERAFSDGLPQSLSSRRNTPSLFNAVFSDRFFYDLRALSLEEQITDVVENPGELNTRLEAIADKINGRNDYKAFISAAFRGTAKPINRYQILAALSSYVVSLRAFNSSFDQYVRGETHRMDPSVIDGFNLFMGKAACGTCHYAPTFSGLAPPLFRESESETLGVMQKPGATQLDPDLGRSHNKQFQDNSPVFDHSFKTLTVRNIERTAPYFHNGAYSTLDEVIDFYDKGGAQGVDLPNQTLSAEPLHLTDKEKAALKAFLRSLTDPAAIQPQ